MSQQIVPYISPEEYLRLERQSEYKSEYVNGEIFAMTGASRKHNLVAGNIFRELSQQLKSRQCEAYVGDMRVKVTATGLYTYPDVAASQSLRTSTLTHCWTRRYWSKCFRHQRNVMTA